MSNLLSNIIEYKKAYDGGKISNLFTEYYKYKRLNKALLKLDNCVNFKEYCRYYSLINYKDKTVVDFGADVGSSAIYFLSKGAKKVICYEIDKNKVKKFNLVVKKLPYTKNLDMSKITFNPKVKATGDVLKMDIEGGEDKVLTSDYIKKFQNFIIALHPQKLSSDRLNALTNIIKKNGGEIIGHVYNSGGIGEIIYAKCK